MDNGNNSRTAKAKYQLEKPATQQAFITTKDNTPPITAFLIFFGEFSLYALIKGE